MEDLQVIYEVMVPDENSKPPIQRSKRNMQWKNLPTSETQEEGKYCNEIEDMAKITFFDLIKNPEPEDNNSVTSKSIAEQT
jgi:hypothetical protein